MNVRVHEIPFAFEGGTGEERAAAARPQAPAGPGDSGIRGRRRCRPPASPCVVNGSGGPADQRGRGMGLDSCAAQAASRAGDQRSAAEPTPITSPIETQPGRNLVIVQPRS